jgi:8-oxo-dGTP pyrophosphatase MutT (NUDIX family)
MTRRPEAMRFLGGFYVFPGGTVHADDYTDKSLKRCRGLSSEQAQRLLGDQHAAAEALGHWVAVVRELFEEVGVLLCVDDSQNSTIALDDSNRERMELARRAIVQGTLRFADFLEAENLICDLSRIVYFDHWVTPAIYSMRFDTRFYIAALPQGQTALPFSEEVTHCLWMAPDEALARVDRRDFPILPPTTIVLDRLARLRTWKRLEDEFEIG